MVWSPSGCREQPFRSSSSVDPWESQTWVFEPSGEGCNLFHGSYPTATRALYYDGSEVSQYRSWTDDNVCRSSFNCCSLFSSLIFLASRSVSCLFQFFISTILSDFTWTEANPLHPNSSCVWCTGSFVPWKFVFVNQKAFPALLGPFWFEEYYNFAKFHFF